MRKLQSKHKDAVPKSGNELCIMATGGGAFKYYDEVKKSLGVEVLREDEMECLIIGESRRLLSSNPFIFSKTPRPDVPPRSSLVNR